MNERRKKLEQTMKKFNKKHKDTLFKLGNEIEEHALIPTGVKEVDDFIGGGLKRGAHTICWGAYSVGKTALSLTTIANAQKEGQLVCYVNTEKPIDPERFRFFGVNLDEMVYIEAPENAEQALEAMRTLCKDKVIDLFIIDSINGLCPKSVQEGKGGSERSLEKKNVAALALTLSNFYNIVNAHIFRSKAAILWIGQGRTQGIGSFFTRMGLSGGNAQQFYAYQIVQMRRGQNAEAPVEKFKSYFIDPESKIRFKTKKEPVGFDVVMKLTKTNSSKSKKENSEIHIPFYYGTGFYHPEKTEDIPIVNSGKNDEEKQIIDDFLKEKGLIKDIKIKVVDGDGNELKESTEYEFDGNDTINLDEAKEEFTVEDHKKEKILKKFKKGRKKKLQNLNEEEFNVLKESGMLWEFYPDAPEFYKDLDK